MLVPKKQRKNNSKTTIAKRKSKKKEPHCLYASKSTRKICSFWKVKTMRDQKAYNQLFIANKCIKVIKGPAIKTDSLLRPTRYYDRLAIKTDSLLRPIPS